MTKPNIHEEIEKLFFLLCKMEEYRNDRDIDYMYIKSRYYRLLSEILR